MCRGDLSGSESDSIPEDLSDQDEPEYADDFEEYASDEVRLRAMQKKHMQKSCQSV